MYPGANNADREIFIFPVQLTTTRIGNLTRLIHNLLYVWPCIHTYISLLPVCKRICVVVFCTTVFMLLHLGLACDSSMADLLCHRSFFSCKDNTLNVWIINNQQESRRFSFSKKTSWKYRRHVFGVTTLDSSPGVLLICITYTTYLRSIDVPQRSINVLPIPSIATLSSCLWSLNISPTFSPVPAYTTVRFFIAI